MTKHVYGRIGLALSGGGFRATLFHLGVVRFLFEVDLLKPVKLVSAVSGGSILAAHLILNWEKYTGSMKDFDAAAREILDFVQADIRGKSTSPLDARLFDFGAALSDPREMEVVTCKSVATPVREPIPCARR
ncbi:MAG TPA: patatin-like phospholipase family protein [Methylocella sp.]|nr:patatin-like phospholipase family protein [Methylocella sp.]